MLIFKKRPSLFTSMHNSQPNQKKEWGKKLKLRNLPLPSLATNPVWSLNAAMQHKQDRTFFCLGPIEKANG